MTRWQRRIATLGIIIVAAMASIGVLIYKWHIDPKEHLTDKADAIVVLAGGEGERLVRAIELYTANRTGIGTLLLSIGGDGWDPRAFIPVANVCNGNSAGLNVVCLRPFPDSTRGEAFTVSKYARAQGWKRIIVVTSDFHLERSMRWFNRCFDGEVYGAAAPAKKTTRLVTHELLGLIAFATVHGSCDL